MKQAPIVRQDSNSKQDPEPIGPGTIPPPGLDDVYLLLPERIGDLDLAGCIAARPLPDGRLLAVEPLLFGRARLCLGRPDVMAGEGAMGGWDDTWDFPGGMAALVALSSWDPAADAEPTGWHRHFNTGRRRRDADPAQEEVRD